MIKEVYMRRALELAALGKGNVSPNPMVGCVIVHEDSIIGEGYHEKYGEAHAEVNAVNSVKDKSKLSQSTVYVTLEPCAHYGKTPPCADLLIKHRVAQVVICNLDPFKKVNGKGIQNLMDAGIEVSTGLLKEEGLKLNRFFFTSISKRRPYIILKWAQTADAFVADKLKQPLIISTKHSQILNHRWRAESDAIMVGFNTANNDNPQLTTRAWKGKNPLRIVIDKDLQLKKENRIFNQEAETLILNRVKNDKINNLEFLKISDWGSLLPNLLQELNTRNIQSLLVEGGPRLHQLFIDHNLFDEVRIIKSEKLIGEGLAAAQPPHSLKSFKRTTLDKDLIEEYLK